MHFPVSAQPRINAPQDVLPGMPAVQHNAPIQTMSQVAALQQFGCAGCIGVGDASFGADPSLTAAKAWPTWVKIGLVLGVVTLGLVTFHYVSR